MPLARILAKKENAGDCREFFSAAAGLLHPVFPAKGLAIYPSDPKGREGHIFFLYSESTDGVRFGTIGTSLGDFSYPNFDAVKFFVRSWILKNSINEASYRLIELEGDYSYGKTPVSFRVEREGVVNAYKSLGVRFFEEDGLSSEISQRGFYVTSREIHKQNPSRLLGAAVASVRASYEAKGVNEPPIFFAGKLLESPPSLILRVNGFEENLEMWELVFLADFPGGKIQRIVRRIYSRGMHLKDEKSYRAGVDGFSEIMDEGNAIFQAYSQKLKIQQYYDIWVRLQRPVCPSQEGNG